MNKFITILISLSCALGYTKTIKPQNITDLHKTSVRIFNLEMNSGGTGSIYKSYKNATHVLTNKHICRVIEQGGYVEQDNKIYPILHYKKYPLHDLCLIRIRKNFGLSTAISDVLTSKSSEIYVSGHPQLLPHIATNGHLSDRMDIELIVGIEKCLEADDPMVCAWFGGKPVIKTFDSQLVSNLIQPGNSGSAVFNKNGEIVGVVFAGNRGEFSYGFIVPHIYVIMFVQNEHRYDWIKVGTPVDNEGMSERFFNYDKCKQLESANERVKEICNVTQNNLIWRK